MHRRIALPAALLVGIVIAAAPSVAQDLAGEWQFTRKARNGFHTGTVVIDKAGKAAMSGRSPLQTYSQSGYVKAAGEQVDIVFTAVKSSLGYSPDRFTCTVRCPDVLSCFNADGYGKEDDLFRLERVGRGTAPSDGRKDDGCPIPERPQS